MRWLFLLVVAFALLAAGCGGGGSNTAATTETTAADTTTTDTTTTEETTSGETTETADTTDLSSVLGDKDCLALASVGATMAKAFAGTNGVSGDTEELDSLASKVPEEIRADVETLAQAFSQYASKLKDIGITPGTTPSAAQLQQLQAALTSLDQLKLTAASQRIEAWSKKNCTG